MKVRLMNNTDADDWMVYEGIRNTAKLKQFILTDLCTAYVYGRVSHRFHSTSDNDDEKRRAEFREMSVRIARSLALDYLGTNEGTPADQVTKRVSNMLAAIDGREQEKPTAATLVTEEQLEATRAFMSGKSPQISVRMSREMASGMGLGAHASIHDVTTRIVQMLVDSRDEMGMQSVMRLQYETMRRTLGDLRKVPDDLALSCTRMYLALRCVLRSDMQSLGDVLEPSFDCSSIMEVVPRMMPGPAMESPVIITVGKASPGLAEGLSQTPGCANGAPVFHCIRDEMDIGIQLYKARLVRGYGGCTVILVTEEPSDADLVSSELERMGWDSASLILLTSADVMPRIHHVNTRGKTPSTISNDLRCLSESGTSSDDARLLSLLCSPYADILSLGYREMDTSRPDPDAGFGVIAGRYERMLSAEPQGGTRFDPFVHCVRSAVLTLIHSIGNR